jgi:phage shock protein A
LQTYFVETVAQEMDEDQVKSGERDTKIREMQKQLKEAQHVIAQFYQERRELKRKLAEKVS